MSWLFKIFTINLSVILSSLLVLMIITKNVQALYHEDTYWWPSNRREDNTQMDNFEYSRMPDNIPQYTPENTPVFKPMKINKINKNNRSNKTNNYTTKEPTKKANCQTKQTYDMITFFQPLIKLFMRTYTTLYVLYLDNYDVVLGAYRFSVKMYSIVHAYLLQGLYFFRLIVEDAAKVMERQQISLIEHEYSISQNRRQYQKIRKMS